MTKELQRLIDSVRGYKITPQERFEQRVSFVYGMQDWDGPMKSKDEIREILRNIYGG